jgi:hypothetical protein
MEDAISDTPEALKMINQQLPLKSLSTPPKRVFAALTPRPRLDHCAAHERFSR